MCSGDGPRLPARPLRNDSATPVEVAVTVTAYGRLLEFSSPVTVRWVNGSPREPSQLNARGDGGWAIPAGRR